MRGLRIGIAVLALAACGDVSAGPVDVNIKGAGGQSDLMADSVKIADATDKACRLGNDPSVVVRAHEDDGTVDELTIDCESGEIISVR